MMSGPWLVQPTSQEYPNIVVAGPVPGETYEKMVLPVLSPDPNTDVTWLQDQSVYNGRF